MRPCPWTFPRVSYNLISKLIIEFPSWRLEVGFLGWPRNRCSDDLMNGSEAFLSESCLKGYLKRYGWTYTNLGEGSLRCEIHLSERPNEVVLTLLDNFIRLRTGAVMRGGYFDTPEGGSKLLQLNSMLTGAALAIHENEIVLVSTLGRHSLSYETFEISLGVLGYYLQELPKIFLPPQSAHS